MQKGWGLPVGPSSGPEGRIEEAEQEKDGQNAEREVGNTLGDMDALGVETENDRVLSGFQANGTQYIVHTANPNLLSVDRAGPFGIVDVAEHSNAALLAAGLIGEFVGLVTGEADGG